MTAAILILLAQVVLPDPQGVWLDKEGVLRTRTEDVGKRLDKIHKLGKGKKKDGRLCYVSLPRVFAEAKKHIDAGEPIPDRIRYLGGITKLQYILIYPDEKDIVIAGRSELFDTKVPFRPVGKLSGRPVLQLDDLVVALRSAGPGKTPPRIGIDIEVTPEIAKRVSEKIRELAPKAQSMGLKKATKHIAEAGGKQPVKYYGIAQNTRFAFVCVEADYLLKHLALGLFKSPVRKVKSYNELIPRPERAHRFSLESKYDAIVVSEDRTAFELQGHSIEVNSGLLQRLGKQQGRISKAADRFIKGCNKNFDAMARAIESWGDLANLSDLTVLAALIDREKLHEKAGWDIGWLLEGYKVAEVRTPTSAHRLCNYHYSGSYLLFTSGGVRLNPKLAEQLTTGDVKKPARPDGEIWIPTE